MYGYSALTMSAKKSPTKRSAGKRAAKPVSRAPTPDSELVDNPEPALQGTSASVAADALPTPGSPTPSLSNLVPRPPVDSRRTAKAPQVRKRKAQATDHQESEAEVMSWWSSSGDDTCSMIPIRQKLVVEASALEEATAKEVSPEKATQEERAQNAACKKLYKRREFLKLLSEQEEEELRDLIQATPIVYDRDDLHFTNKDMKNAFWAKVDEKYFESKTGSGYKWYNNKRSTFGKLLNEEKYQKSGTGVTITDHKQKLLSQWRFLEAHVKPIKTRQGVDLVAARDERYGFVSSSSDKEWQGDEMEELALSEEPPTSQQPTLYQTLDSESGDECQHHGDYLATLMRKMTPELQDDFVLQAVPLAIEYVRRSRQQCSTFPSQVSLDGGSTRNTARSSQPVSCIQPGQMRMQHHKAPRSRKSQQRRRQRRSQTAANQAAPPATGIANLLGEFEGILTSLTPSGTGTLATTVSVSEPNNSSQ